MTAAEPCERTVVAWPVHLATTSVEIREGHEERDTPMMGLIIGSIVVKTKAFTVLVSFSTSDDKPGIFSIVRSMPLTTCQCAEESKHA